MNVTRHEKVNRLAETGQNLCGNAFFSNAERIMDILENKDCSELAVSLSMVVKASNKDDLGVGKIEFHSPSIVISKTSKYKDSLDDVVLNFVEPELPGLDADGEKGKKQEKQVKGVVIGASHQLTTEILIYKDEKSGKTYFAGAGLGENTYMTFKGLPTDSSRHRFVNKALPVQDTLEQAESDLIAYATKKGWKRVDQEEQKPKGDTMAAERTLDKIIEQECKRDGCCSCEKEKCQQRIIKFGGASICDRQVACSAECPRLIIKEKEELNLDIDGEYNFGGEGLRECDNAFKLSKFGYTALMLREEDKEILEWHSGRCFRPVGDVFKTKAATKRAFEGLLLDDKGLGYVDANSENDWLRRAKMTHCKLFRGRDYNLTIVFQTNEKSWGSPEKFNTEAQFKNRMDELRKKLDHFEA